jgi:hypothetical protein
VEQFRRKAQRENKRSLLFLDETHCVSNAIPLYSLALPGQKAKQQVQHEAFGFRVDVLDSCAVDALGPYHVITPSDRRALGTRGITKELFLDFFEAKIIPFANLRFMPKTIFIVDKATVHDMSRMYDAAHDLMPDTIVKVWFLPTNSAKFLSPLDNGFHSELQHGVADLLQYTDRSEAAVAECIHTFMRRNGGANLDSYYHHCGLYASRGLASRL